MKKIIPFFIFCFLLSAFPIQAQHLFSVSYNDLPQEKILLLKTEMVNKEVSSLSLIRNKENSEIFSVPFSSVGNTKLILLNEQNGKHVTITPVEEVRTEFQLSPFFIAELKQGVLGEASQYLILETSLDLSVRNISAVDVSHDEVFIPQFFYGKKENVQEALPRDRQIVHIIKQKPRLILAYPDDPELLSYAEQYEEAMSYYVYLYNLPDGVLFTYDEHFNPLPEENAVVVGGTRGKLQFTLSGNLNATQKPPTEYALAIWSDNLAGTVPVRINVDSKDLGNTGIIGQSWRMTMAQNTGQVPTSPTDTWYPGALWNQLVGYSALSGYNIKLEMNSQFSFYYGTSGNPSYSQIDWITTMLHEVNHGLGFFPICQSNGSYSANSATPNPGIFDRQLFQGIDGPCLVDLSQADRAALVKSNNLYAGAPDSHLLAAHGSRVKMYAPTSYSSGSSCSHWDSYQTFTTFMKYYIDWGWKWHTVTTREMGIFLDMGWTIPDPNAIYVTFNANGGEGTMTQQEFTIGVAQNLKANSFTKEGCSFSKWTTNQNGTGTSYTNQQSVTISDHLTLYAQWNANTYTLTFNPGTDGTVDITSKQVTYGEPVGALPQAQRPGYKFVGWRILGTPYYDIDEQYIWNFGQDKTATARWEMITYTITATATPGGKISPPATNTVQEGNDKTYTITPNQDYYIGDVLVDDVSVGAVSEYTFFNVTADHTIHAVFTNVGIKENKSCTTILMVPNPASQTVELRITNYELRVTHIEFYNIFGQVVKTVPFAGETSQESVTQKIDISDFCAGLYMVKVGDRTVKLIVK